MSGIRVVDMSSWTFVPAAATVLADWGAEVIKVEDPVRGDPQRGLTNALTGRDGINPMIELPNRGKRSLGLNLAGDPGHEVFVRLIRTADVFMTNFLPAVREKLGVTLADLRSINPNIIYALGTAQGSSGPELHRGGFDLATAWARSGVAHRMTPPGGEPPNQPGSLGDLTAGLTLAGGVAAALLKRERTGIADQVEVSLYGIGMWWMAQAITAGSVGIETTFRTRANPTNSLVNYFPTSDGRWICLTMLQSDRWWSDLCHHLERDDLTDDPRFSTERARMANVSEFTAVLDAVFRTRTLQEWRNRLATAEGVWAPVLSPAEVADDPQAISNGYLPEVDRGNGTAYRTVSSPMQFGGSAIGALGGAPEHGQHTESILLELGFTWDEIIDLKEVGSVQ